MSTGKPPDFEPLASSDPVPGNPDDIASLGRRYTDTAAEIAAQAAHLRELATAAPGGWVGKSGNVFHSHASDLATRISAAHGRYAATGQALTAAAGPMGEAQEDAWAAVWAAKDAQQRMTASAPAPPAPPGSPPPTDQEKAQARAKAGNYSDAQGDYSAAVKKFDGAVGQYQSAAGQAAARISAAVSHDGVHDSWWDSNFGWLNSAFKIIGMVALALAVVVIILAIPGAGELLAAGLVSLGMGADAAAGVAAAVGTVALLGSTGASVVQTAFAGIAAGTGKESWTSFIIDCASLATFGAGKAAGAAIEGLADGAGSTGMAVAAGRAGRAAMGTFRGLTYSLGSRSETAESLVRAVGLGGRFDQAEQAAADARTGLAALLKTAEPGKANALLTISRADAVNLAKLKVLSEQVPNVLRISVPRITAQGIAISDGVAQWASRLGSASYSIHNWVVGGGSDSSAISQSVGQFRQALSHVP
jgi:uncharacterized protein YukE